MYRYPSYFAAYTPIEFWCCLWCWYIEFYRWVCHVTLYQVHLKISKKIPLAPFGGLQSKDLQTSCNIEQSWYLQESEVLNPDWLGQSKLFSSRYVNIELKIIFQRFFQKWVTWRLVYNNQLSACPLFSEQA